jgi:flavin-dependent dehydrogenase
MMRDMEADAVIVGAGVAGLALAAQLGRSGHSVLLIEKSAAPWDKVCGEGIMPLGLRALKEMELDADTLPGVDFHALEFHTSRQRHTLRFAPGIHGRGVRRTALIAHLQHRALEQPCVTLVREAILAPQWSGGRVAAVCSATAAYRGRVIVAADGVHSVLSRRCGAAPRVYGERMAVRRHYRVPDEHAPDRVHVGLFGRHDLYLTPVGDGAVLATAMTDRSGCGVLRRNFDAFLRASPFAALLAGAEPASEVLAWHHPLFYPACYTPGGVWLVGDASGGIDPCLGMGISMALTQARQAAALLDAWLRNPSVQPVVERRYEAWRGALFHHYHHFGRLFRSLAIWPAGCAVLLGAMRLWPAAAERVFASVAEMRPWPLYPPRAVVRHGKEKGGEERRND